VSENKAINIENAVDVPSFIKAVIFLNRYCKTRTVKMAVVTSKTGNQTESFNVFKQKVGKQTSSFRGFKQHFSSSTIHQDKSGNNQHASAAMKEEVTVEEQRGFVPSDVLNDPSKREFLTQLSKRMWMEKEKLLSKCQNSAKCRVLRKRYICSDFFYSLITPLSHVLIFTYLLVSHTHTRADLLVS